jgi:glycosyltransferase involved in cell wall biosynthesis
MAHAVMKMIADDPLRSRMSRNAAQHAAMHYGKQRMVDEYLSFYEEAVEDWKSNKNMLTN